jgi:hypothetical protein
MQAVARSLCAQAGDGGQLLDALDHGIGVASRGPLVLLAEQHVEEA